MTNRKVSKSSTTDGRAMWEQVGRVAQEVPEWVKSKVSDASTSAIREITGKHTSGKQQSN